MNAEKPSVQEFYRGDNWSAEESIGYLLRNFEMLDADVADVVETYFKQCSLLVTAHDLAVMGATLANRGVNPVTGRRALRTEHVARVLSVMSTCGMYDYAGEWLYRVGLPAKSGVAGGILAATTLSCVGTWLAMPRNPMVVVSPAVAVKSLGACGKPCIQPCD